MIEKKIQFRKRRELGEIISDSFTFIKQEFKPLLQIIITYVLPFLVVYGVVQINIQKKIFASGDISTPEALIAHLEPYSSNLLLFSIFAVFVHALLIGAVYSYIEIYIEKGKGNFDLSEVKTNLFSNGQLAIGSGILYFIFAMFGLLLFVFPGLFFAVIFSLVAAVVIFEKKGIGHAFSNSWKLVRTQWWQTLLLIIIGLSITWAVGIVLSTTSLLINPNPAEVGAEQAQSHWIIMGITTVVSSLFWVFPYTFLAFQYFNLNERVNPTIKIEKDEFA
jgi:hypothetical protein